MATLLHSLSADLDLNDLDNPLRGIRTGALIVMALALGIGFWLVLAPLSGAVIGPGVVKVDSNRKTVQHQEGGIVREVLVRNGDKVRAGQTLLVIGDVRVDASEEMVRTQLDSELARAARLDAERGAADEIDFADELTARAGDSRVSELMSRERTLFAARRTSLKDQIRLIEEQAVEAQSEIQSRISKLGADESSRDLVREELTANEALSQQGFVSKVRVLSLKRGETELAARHEENKAEISKARQRIAELRLRAAGMRHSFMQEAADEHKRSSATVFDLRERLRPLQDAQTRQNVTAPVAGEIVDLRVTGAGTVIGPRDPILDIVPENADLIIEARIRPEDINYVSIGAQADVHLSAFKQRITPVVRGSVTYVSADRLEDKALRAYYYSAYVKVSAQSLREAGELKLQAGMPAEVFVKTSEHTAMEYLVAPVQAFLRRAMREP